MSPIWAKWLHNPCSLGVPRGQHTRIRLRDGYPTLAVSGAQIWGNDYIGLPSQGPRCSAQEENQKCPQCNAKWLHNPCCFEGPKCSAWGSKSKSANITLAMLGADVWAKWLHNPCRLGGPQCGEENTSYFLRFSRKNFLLHFLRSRKNFYCAFTLVKMVFFLLKFEI